MAKRDTKEKKLKEIVIGMNNAIRFWKNPDAIDGNVLILGNFNGVCGKCSYKGLGKGQILLPRGEGIEEDGEILVSNLSVIINVLTKDNRLVIAASRGTIEYFNTLIYALWDCYGSSLFPGKDTVWFKKMLNRRVYTIDITEIYEKAYVLYNTTSKFRKNQAKDKISDIVKKMIVNRIGSMKFNLIISNPPYNGDLHLKMFTGMLNALDSNGKMSIIEPSTWLINVKKGGALANKAKEIKDAINGHVERVVIENLNAEFGTELRVPFSITTIDMSKTFDHIEFECCGETKIVKSIYDCNLIGNYDTIWGILNKVLEFGDMMKNHITKKNEGKNFWYVKYGKTISGAGGSFCGIKQNGCKWDGENLWMNLSSGSYISGYLTPAWHFNNNYVSDKPHFAYDAGKHLLCDRYENGKFISGTIADNLYGTKEEMENWEHFIFHNKLSLFINIVLTIHECNVVTSFLPWLVDKQYTDEEINQKFGFTEDEIALIDATLKKFERNSSWFKRYMCGVSTGEK